MKKNIGIITLPIGKSGANHLENLVELMDPITDKIYLITGNCGYDFFKNNTRVIASGNYYQTGKNPVTRVIKYVHIQVQLSIHLIHYSRNVDTWIFYLSSNLILPKIVAKILGKTVIEIFAGSPTQTMAIMNDPFLIPMKYLSKINFMLSDKIVLYSKNLMIEWQIEGWQNKIVFAPRHYVNFNLFNRTNNFSSRKKIIGFVGRLSEEKGFLNLMHAIPKIVKTNPGVEILIIGDGKLQKEILNFINKNKLKNHVSLEGWCNLKKMPNYLNQMKLLIVPSYTEGLPNVILEAMACGTPVLASSVGSIPDIIVDNVNGFLLKDNSQNSIETDVLRILEYEDLELISANAEKYVRDSFSLSAARLRIQKILYCS